MYLRSGQNGTYYGSDGQQRHSRAPFLLLIDASPSLPAKQDACMYAIVREVAMEQCGHFMMGTARVYGHSLTVSGTYGSDGLPISLDRLPVKVQDKVRAEMVRVPDELYRAWAKGGGWNGSGSEGPAMQAWARKTFKV